MWLAYAAAFVPQGCGHRTKIGDASGPTRATPPCLVGMEPGVAPLVHTPWYLKSSVTSGSAAIDLKLYLLDGQEEEGGHNVMWELRRMFDHLAINTPLARWWRHVQGERIRVVIDSFGWARIESVLRAKAIAARKAQSSSAPLGCQRVFSEMVVKIRVFLFCLIDWAVTCRKKQSRDVCLAVLREFVQQVPLGIPLPRPPYVAGCT